MRRISARGVFLILVIFLACGHPTAQDLGGLTGDPAVETTPRATPGVILVTVRQGQHEPNRFFTLDRQVRSTLGENADSELEILGLRSCKMVYKGNGYSTYALLFNRRGNESAVLEYLRAQPWVVRAKLDYAVQLLCEPNDPIYQPDSTDYSTHWVPSWFRYPNTAYYRLCEDTITSQGEYTCCCEDPCGQVRTDWPISELDSLHMCDQWYLQRVRANRAWDIEKGEAGVKIMIIDSGVDLDHPDLNGHMWDNSSVDPPGDANRDGRPGGYGGFGFFNPTADKDIDGDGLTLYGTDGECDCGPDGDYGFGPNAIDDYPPGPGGGDDDPPGSESWKDNLCGPGNETHPLDTTFNDDMDDVQFMKNDDDANGYPDDTYGVNLYDLIDDFGLGGIPDGLPGVAGWGTDDIDKDGGKHFDDPEVRVADFDGDGVPLCGADGQCDAGPDGDYGFGANGVDNYPPGPTGLPDDDWGPKWADNRRGPGSAYVDSLPDFDDDMVSTAF
jgi:hypothetical protein